MKKIYFLLTVIAGFLFFLLNSAMPTEDSKYYYAFEEKIPLIPKENTLLIKYVDSFDKTEAKEFLKAEIPSGFKEKWHDDQTVEITTESEKITNALKEKLESNNRIYTCQPFYTLKDWVDMGVTDEVLICFLSGISEEQKKKLIKSFDTELVKTTKIYQKLKVKKGADALEIANKIYESGLVKFSTPNFISYSELHQITPNDTYYSNQITCNNTGQTFTDGHSGTNDADIDAPEAWEITTGSSDIVVAILDQGVTSDHPDLPNSRQIRLAGSNFVEGNDDPSPGGNANHGNACAGVIAATMNNNQGIAGIASNCKIMPIRIYDDNGNGVSAELKADAIELAVDNGANILSNSWGYESTNQNLHPVIVTAINYALDSDRVVIFSAGNNARHYSCDDDGYVAFPANVNISGVITVGASDRNDNQSDYSPTSSLIDIVAPSHRAYPPEVYYPDCGGISGETLEMWSIDIPDSAGYNSYPANGTHPPTTGEILPSTGTNNLAYTARFGGTSHSCPVVAGVAALILSVNPDLSYTDVFDILTSTADEVGGFTYSSGKCDEMGYGRVNAFEALKAVYPITGPSYVCTSGTEFFIENADGDTIEWDQSSNIYRDSPQGSNPCTFSAVGYGNGWISATVNGVELPRIDVFSEYTNLSGCFMERGSILWRTLYTVNTISADEVTVEVSEPGVSSFDWSLEYSNGTVYWGTLSDGATMYFNLVTADDVHFEVSYDKGECGEVTNNYHFIKGNRLSLAIAPNPTTGEATLVIKSESEEKDFDDNAKWVMEIYSPMQALQAKKTKLKGNSTTIQTAGWMEGVYTVRVKYKDQILTGKLIVKR